MSRIVGSIGAGGTALLLVSGAGTAAPTVPPNSPDSARIAFASHRDGNWEIYATDADGQNQTRLTTRKGHTRFPLWSPDRKQIAFAAQVGDPVTGWDLWVMNADGNRARRLSSDLVAKSGREWSPDGRQIAFTRKTGDNMDVYVVTLESGATTRLTTSAGDDRDPAWSPDGSLIVFTSERDGNREVYAMNAAGGNVRRLTSDPGREASPSYSPDGTRILFVSDRSGTSELHLMRPDGQDIERLTTDGFSSTDLPRWSPDGTHIAFQVAAGSRYDIGLFRLRDKKQRVLVATEYNDGSYAWAPDSRRLTYISGPNGSETLHVVNVEGSRSTQITTTWSLTPTWIR